MIAPKTSAAGSLIQALLLAALGVMAVTGCRTIPADKVASFATAIAAEKTHSQEVFTAVDELIASAALDYAAKQSTLSEANFSAGLDENGLEIWEGALDKLERYAQHLQALTAPELSKAFEDASVGLGQELQSFGDRLKNEHITSQSPKFDPTLAAGFTELGSVVIRLKAQSDARKILKQTDPEIRKVLLEMARSVGSSTTEGIRGTIKAHWNTMLAAEKADFLQNTDPTKRREVAASFQVMLQKRAAQDSALLSLHRSLLALADLHRALATGDAPGAQQLLDVIGGEINRTSELKARFENKSSN